MADTIDIQKLRYDDNIIWNHFDFLSLGVLKYRKKEQKG